MAIQVTPNIGGTTATVPVGDTTPIAPSQTPSVPPPSYQLNFAGLSRAAAVGLSNPTSAGDLEIIFAQIAAKVKDSIGSLTDVNNAVKAEGRRGQLGNFLAAYNQMVNWGAVIDQRRADNKVQEATIETQTNIKTAAEGKLQTLNGALEAVQGQITSNNSTISSARNSIDSLTSEKAANEAEIKRLDPVKDATKIATLSSRNVAIPGLILGYQAVISQKEGENLTLQGDVTSLKSQIKVQQDIVADATRKITDAQNTIVSNNRTINLTIAAMQEFIAATISAINVAAGKVKSEMAQDAGQVTVEGDSFETLLSDMASALVKLTAAMTEQQVSTDLVQDGTGAGLNLDESQPNRFGQPNATVARAVAFSGMIAGTMGAIADLLRNLSQGLGMQSAGDMASAGASRVKVPV